MRHFVPFVRKPQRPFVFQLHQVVIERGARDIRIHLERIRPGASAPLIAKVPSTLLWPVSCFKCRLPAINGSMSNCSHRNLPRDWHVPGKANGELAIQFSALEIGRKRKVGTFSVRRNPGR